MKTSRGICWFPSLPAINPKTFCDLHCGSQARDVYSAEGGAREIYDLCIVGSINPRWVGMICEGEEAIAVLT